MPPLRPRKDTLQQPPATVETKARVALKRRRGPVLWQLSKRKRFKAGDTCEYPPHGVDAFPPIPYEREQRRHGGAGGIDSFVEVEYGQEEEEDDDDGETVFDAPDTCQSRQKRGRIQNHAGKEPKTHTRRRQDEARKKRANPAKKSKAGQKQRNRGKEKRQQEAPDNLDVVSPGAILALPHKAVEPDSLGRENPVWAFYKAKVITVRATKKPHQLEIKFRWNDGSGRGKQIVDSNNMRSGKKMFRSMRRKAGKCEHNRKAKTSWGCVKPAAV